MNAQSINQRLPEAPEAPDHGIGKHNKSINQRLPEAPEAPDHGIGEGALHRSRPARCDPSPQPPIPAPPRPRPARFPGREVAEAGEEEADEVRCGTEIR